VSDSIIALMLGVSTMLGAFGLIALLWGGENVGGFDDQVKLFWMEPRF